MREVVFDVETTGLDPHDGHRITEIGLVELVERMPTGKTFQRYLDPEREVDADSVRITGLTNEKLRGMPKFAQVAQDFLDFVGDAPIVAHNASFDMSFINMELSRLDIAPLQNDVVDTLEIARKKYPGARNSLDALCQRFEVDSSARDLHGALLDSELLAEVYLELTGGRQHALLDDDTSDEGSETTVVTIQKGEVRAVRHFEATAEEIENHKAFVSKIDNAIWAKLSLNDSE